MLCFIGPEFRHLLLKRSPAEMLCRLPIDGQRIRGKYAEQEKQTATALSGHSKGINKKERENVNSCPKFAQNSEQKIVGRSPKAESQHEALLDEHE